MKPHDLDGTETLAERRDDELGVREVFSFLGSSGQRIATTSHIPLGPTQGAVVICSSILGDFPKNYRREVGLGRTLASRGIAVRRFHYRGCGNSDGSSAVTSFSSMCEDARIVAEGLIGIGTVGFVGTRMGALVAANAAVTVPGSPLALIEPVILAENFYREGFRARMMRDLKDQVDQKPSSKRLLAELEEKGVLDVFGYPLDRNLYDSTSALKLEDQLPVDARSVLLLQLGGSELNSEFRQIAERFATRSPQIETALDGKADAWWFLDDQQPALESGFERVADWLLAKIADRPKGSA